MSGSTLLAHTRQEEVKARDRAARRNTGDQEEKEGAGFFWWEDTYGRKKQQKMDGGGCGSSGSLQSLGAAKSPSRGSSVSWETLHRAGGTYRLFNTNERFNEVESTGLYRKGALIRADGEGGGWRGMQSGAYVCVGACL